MSLAELSPCYIAVARYIAVRSNELRGHMYPNVM